MPMSHSAPLFNVQSLSTQDGPGLRSAVFLQGCPLRCTWCSNPEGQAARPQLMWHELRCQRCHACATACPHGAVRTSRELPPQSPGFDRAQCESCTEWQCIDACPHAALQRVGRLWNADELLAVLEQDVRLYRNSGGGVTFTGGEPLVHSEFVSVVARDLRKSSIHVAIETCGLWNWTDAADCLKYCDLVFFDVKALDDDLHRRFTGSSNERILCNLRQLAETRAATVIVTVPVIPGVLDRSEAILEVGAYVRSLGLAHVRLLPYHSLARSKYAALGRPYPHAPWDAGIPRNTLRSAVEKLTALGLDVCVEGF